MIRQIKLSLSVLACLFLCLAKGWSAPAEQPPTPTTTGLLNPAEVAAAFHLSEVEAAAPTAFPTLTLRPDSIAAATAADGLQSGVGASDMLPVFGSFTDMTAEAPSGSVTGAPAAARRSGWRWDGNATRYFEGAFVGLLGHESGHLIANWSMNTHPWLRGVTFGPFPWFTIEPGRPVTRHEHYITASAGFDAQHLINEWILDTHPNLREEHDPFLKGIVTFNFWLTMGYAACAFAGYGPSERDTKGMADALGWNERAVGAMILVPTVLDTYRYRHPQAKWAKWASRLSKLFIIALAAKAH